ncbi:MAG: right-handed parallel beta-helix repeat-containing protein [Candidatus Electrothrix sp. AR3]|nr:right-handed parallel beta-helix repeat-containing protein [Candidatus Electrothrix sp. AR3]
MHDTRSGGIGVSWQSNNIFIKKVITSNNYLDGIALYNSTNVIVSDFISKNNGAGIRLDNNLNKIVFNDGIIYNNSDVGIFVRNTSDVTFSNIVISTNGNHGAFMHHDEANPETTGVTNILFMGCTFQNNNGYGLQLSSPSPYSYKNAVAGSLFSDNFSGCFMFEPNSMAESANVCF